MFGIVRKQEFSFDQARSVEGLRSKRGPVTLSNVLQVLKENTFFSKTDTTLVQGKLRNRFADSCLN